MRYVAVPVEGETTTDIGSVTEEWRPVDICPGYEVSNLGRFKRTFSAPWTKPGIMHQRPCNYGYFYVTIDGRNYKIHRLVARAFIGEPNGLQVNHKDGNKQNNAVWNLEYVTNQQNIQHAYNIGLNKYPEGQKNRAKLTREQVELIVKLSKEGATRASLGRMFGVTPTCIQYAVIGKSWPEVERG